MGALSDIQTILKSDNLDGSIWGIKPQLEAWEEELSTPAVLPNYLAQLTIAAQDYKASGVISASAPSEGIGFALVLTTPPNVVAASGEVVNLSSVGGSIANFPTDVNDDFDIDARLLIHNTADTQEAAAHLSDVLSAGDDSYTLDFTGATPTIGKGADLAWTTGSLVTTAGGIFVVTLLISGGWD